MRKTKSTAPTIRETVTFVTVQEAAAFLHLSQVSIYRWIAQGKIKKFKVGSRTLLKKNDVLGLICEAPATEVTTAK
jgi:excisionase family DNA binding protein